MSTAPIAPRPNRRFWLTVAAFAVANVFAWVVWGHHLAASHRGTLRLTSVEPGDDAAVAPTATIRWHFDSDVIPTDVYARPPGQVSPPVAGRWAWESPRTLAFVPAVALPRATPVTFTLAADLIRTTTGGQLGQPCVTRIRPAPLAVRSARQSATLDDDAFVIELAFTDRVAPGDVLAHLVATRPDGRPVACHLLGQATGPVVRLRTDPLPPGDGDNSLSLTLSPGLVGTAGPLGLDQPYHATVALTRSLSATALSAENPSRGRPSLLLAFNGEVDFETLRQVLSVDPPVPFTISTHYSGGEFRNVSLTGDFRAGTRYAVTLSAPPPGSRGQYPRPGTLATVVPDLTRDCWLDNDQGYLSTAGNRALLAHVVNVAYLHVTVTRVYDDNLVAWRNAVSRERSEYSAGEEQIDAFARPAADRRIPCPGPRNQRRDVRLSLDDLLPRAMSHSGAWRVVIEPPPPADGDDEQATSGGSSAVVTLSDVGLTAKRTRGGLVAWATSLRSATPLPGVRVRAYSDKNQLLGTATTDADGLAHLSRLHPAPGEAVAVLLADVAPDELTWLDLRKTEWDLADADTSGQPYLRTGHAAFVYADRGVYRPGETVHLRAIVRGPGDVAPKHSFPVRWRFRRPDLHDWRTVNAMLDADGATAADVPLPADLPTGQWTAEVSLAGDAGNPFGSVSFGVEEFVPNRLKVGLKLGSGDRYAIGDEPLGADVQADYLFGRPAAGLGVDLSAHATPVPFAPADWADWTFGDAADTQRADGPAVAGHHKRHNGARSDEPATASATLDDAGRYHGSFDVADLVHLDDAAAAHPNRYRGPWRVTAEASVREAGGRAVTVAKQVDVDAVPAYVGVRRAADSQPAPGEPCPFRFQLVRPDGTADPRAADLTVRLLRESWNTNTIYRDGRYEYDSTRLLDPVVTATLHTEAGAATWSPTPPDAGEYVLEATQPDSGVITTTAFYATDGQGWDDTVDRTHPDRLDVRVLGPGEPDVPAADARTRPADVPQKVGTTARVLVAAPFAGRLLLTVETDDVVQSQVIDMPASHVVVPIDVTAACRPGAFVTATVIRPIDPDAAWKPHRAFGVARLNVDPSDRKLTVAIDAPTELRPMRSLDVGLTVTDPDGNPVAGAAVNVAAVDEGICSLTDFATPDPLAFFTSRRALGVESGDLYGLLMPEAARPDVGGDGSGPEAGGARHHSPVGGHRVRPVALAWAAVHTDSAGHAVASFPVPTFQGQLRVMAVAYTVDRVGSADRDVTVRSPLLAQTSWPRFAAPGDRFTVPVVLFNNTPVGGTATVTVEPVGDLLTLGGPVAPVALPAGGQRQVDLDVTVAQAVGVARVRLTATMNGEQYQEELELPVRPAAPEMQFGGIARGTTARPTMLAGLVPMMPGTGSLHVDVTPWPTLNLHKGLDYLDRYPYGCAEQTTSTLFPLVALGEIGRAVDPARFDPVRIRDKVDAGVVQLIGMQTADGGLAMWPGGSDDWPWASVYAAHFLTVARSAGYAVPDDFYDHLIAYVRHQLDQATVATDGLEVQAYAAYVMALGGRPDRAAMSRLGELVAAPGRPGDAPGIDGAGGDARLFLSLAELLAGRRDVAESLLPAGMPPVRAGRQHDGNLASPTRDRALLILAAEEVDPDRADLPDLVQQLADTPWASTQDVAFSVLAIGEYLQAEADRHPTTFDAARLLVGPKVLASSSGGAPLAWEGPAQASLRIELAGAADAVGHIGWLQTGVPLSPPPAASHGMTIGRRYVTADGRDVRGVVRSGDLVRVELTIDGPAHLPNVVVDDLLPAGLEVENARLATAAHDQGSASSDVPAFGDVTDVRDDRVVIVGSIAGSGHCRATYLARAVTPGVYVAPPARAEAMYDLNTNAISASGTLAVTGAASNVAAAE
jgi:uncharacterized protein YfaS (alpha-2-macroglobulin family)